MNTVSQNGFASEGYFDVLVIHPYINCAVVYWSTRISALILLVLHVYIALEAWRGYG